MSRRGKTSAEQTGDLPPVDLLGSFLCGGVDTIQAYGQLSAVDCSAMPLPSSGLSGNMKSGRLAEGTPRAGVLIVACPCSSEDRAAVS